MGIESPQTFQNEQPERREPGTGYTDKERYDLGRTLRRLTAVGSIGLVGAGLYQTYKENPDHFTSADDSLSSAESSQPASKNELRRAIEELAPGTVVIDTEEMYTTEPISTPEVEPTVTNDVETDVQSVADQPVLDVAPERSLRPQVRPEVSHSTVETVDQEQFERLPENSVQFLTRVIARKEFFTMPDGVLVKDKSGRTLGSIPVQIIDDINPGVGYNELGHANEGYDSRWRKAARKLAAQSFSVPEEQLELAYNWKEMTSAATKLGGYQESMFGGVLMFAEQPVSEKNSKSRLAYLHEHLSIPNERMPAVLKQNLEWAVLGIPAEESRFDESVVSYADAVSTFQILRSVWESDKGLGLAEYDSYGSDGPPYELQVAGFLQHLSNLYNETHTTEMEPVLSDIRSVFSSDEAFYKYFVVPWLIDGYHAGGGTARSLAKAFVASDEFAELKHNGGFDGYDVYDAASAVAAATDKGALKYYGSRSLQYAPSVLAFATLLHQKLDQREDQKVYQLASNE